MTTPTGGRPCSSCAVDLPKSAYSKTQWSKNPGVSKCKGCVASSSGVVPAAGAPQSAPVAPTDPPPPIPQWPQTATADDDEANASDAGSDDSFGTAHSSQGSSSSHASQDSLPTVASYIGAVDTTREESSSSFFTPVAMRVGSAGKGSTGSKNYGEEGDDLLGLSSIKRGGGSANRLESIPSERFHSTTSNLSDSGNGVADIISSATPLAKAASEEEDTVSPPIGMKKSRSRESLISVDMPDMDDDADKSTLAEDLNHILDGAVEGLEELEKFSESLDVDEKVLRASVESETSSRLGFTGNARELLQGLRAASSTSVTSLGNSGRSGVSATGVGNGAGMGARKTSLGSVAGEETDDDDATVSSLPSYNFTPAVREKSDRIVRSYRPSVSSRFRGASLLNFRRPSANAGAASAENFGERSSSGFASIDEEGFPHKSAKATTEATFSDNEENDDEEDDATNGPRSISVGSLLKDTYSFLYVYPTCSSPFFYSLFLFFFQSLVYGLLLSSLIDAANPENMLHVPPSVGVPMRVAQGCAIFIAVANSVDVMVALNNLLRTPDAIIVIDSATNASNGETVGFLSESSSSHNNGINHLSTPPSSELSSVHDHGVGLALASTRVPAAHRASFAGGRRSFPAGARFKFANLLRLIEGCLAVTTAFILIVRSDDVIEMFINFAALEFVVNLDNLAFALAEHGLVSDKLLDAARFVSGLGFAYSDSHLADSSNHRTKKKRGGSCTPVHLARLKGSYLSRIFGSPVRCMKNHPDGTRRTTLLVMTLALFGTWGWILTGLNYGNYLCKNIHIEFFHAHVAANTAAEAEEGIKPFLASRSGTYVAAFIEDDQSNWEKFTNIATGKSNLFLAYRKVDLVVEGPAEPSLVPSSALPLGYVAVVYYDPDMRRWVFTSCDPDTDLLRERACTGPQVHSVETDSFDLTALSLAAFNIVDDDPNTAALALPATVTCNECGPSIHTVATGSVDSDVQSCGLSGGECAPPNEDLGNARQCLCPPGEYGPFCTEHYGTSCSTLEIVPVDIAVVPPGAMTFQPWEERRPFALVPDLRGADGAPVWERKIATRGMTDRMERRGGTHWIITRTNDVMKTSRTIAMAEDMTSGGRAIQGGGATTDEHFPAGWSVQPPPAGLMFHAPRAAAWGVQPDYNRPYAAYEVRCKALPFFTQLTATP